MGGMPGASARVVQTCNLTYCTREFRHGSQTPQVAILRAEGSSGHLPLATAERPVKGRRMRRVQRMAFLHSVQVDHGIERLSRTRDDVQGSVPDAG